MEANSEQRAKELAELRLKVLEARGMKLRNLTETGCEMYVGPGQRMENLEYDETGEWIKCGAAPDPTTDIGDAWDLLDFAQEEPFEQAVEVSRCVALRSSWSCSIGNITARADTAPEAISRAFVVWYDKFARRLMTDTGYIRRAIAGGPRQ